MTSFVSIHKSKMALHCRGNNVIHYISFVRIKSPNSQQFNMDCDDDDGDDDEYGAGDDGDDEDDNGDGVLECDRGGQHDLAEQPFQGSAIYLFVGEGRHGEDGDDDDGDSGGDDDGDDAEEEERRSDKCEENEGI